MTAQAPVPSTDGRHLRAEASRAKIVAAMLELCREGFVAPAAEAVAERAGVGLRTVFRLFKDMDGLYREAQSVMLLRLAPIAAEPIVGETWRDQLDALIHRRARLFEELMPIKVAADAQRAMSPYLQREHRHLVRLQRETALGLLPAETRADTVLAEMMDLVMSFDSWRRLRLEQGLAPDAAEAIMHALVSRVVDRP